MLHPSLTSIIFQHPTLQLVARFRRCVKVNRMKYLLFYNYTQLVVLAALLINAKLTSVSYAGTTDPDLSDARVQTLRIEYAGKRDALAKQQAADLASIAADGLTQAHQMQAKAKVSGNVTALAAANAAVRIYTDASAALTKNGVLRFPDSIRPDLETFVDGSRKSQQAVAERHASALRALDAEYAPRLTTLISTADNVPDTKEKQLALLNKLAGTPTGATTNDNANTNTIPADAILIRASRDAQQWETVLRGEIHVSTLEIIPVTIAGITAQRQNQSTGDESRQPFSVKLTPAREFVPVDPSPAFRVMSLPPLTSVDVVSWPTAANGWTLELRVRPTRGGTSRQHGFVLEVDATAKATRPLPGQTASASTPPAVAPSITPIKNANTTPAGPSQPSTTLPKIFHVSACESSWLRTGIQVRKGAHIQTTIIGTWSCGPGGELVDAAGYPNNDRFFRYYMDQQLNPRVSLDANYGALIARIQPEGTYHSIGKQTSFTVDKTGELTLDINEDPSARRDNKGTLEVRIIVTP